jgi:hypothetical protein
MRAGCVTSINILPDDVLLLIFHFDRVTYFEDVDRMIDDPRNKFTRIGSSDRDIRLWSLPWGWCRLAHVCQRWRSVVFASPNFLELKLVCGPKTRVGLTGIWPSLPIIIRDTFDFHMPEDYDFDAAIVHRNRVCDINLYDLSNSQLLRLASAMQDQFPALIHLMLDFYNYHGTPAPAFPDGFSAPRLQTLILRRIPFPTLPKLLLSATDLVELTLVGIPQTGYFTPVALVAGLTVSANLKSLVINFKSPLSRPDRESRHPLPTIRSVLPALTYFHFHGVSEYLEDVVARIDAPLLCSLDIMFFNQLIFDIPQLSRFLERATKLKVFDNSEACVRFYIGGVLFGSPPWTRSFDEGFELMISSTELDWQLSSLAPVLMSFLPFTYTVEHLYISGNQPLPPQWLDYIEDVQWLDIFYPFTAVKNLYVREEFAQCIAFALQELVVERVIEVFPALETLFLEALQPSGPVQEAIGKFVTARELLGHPVAVSQWNRT